MDKMMDLYDIMSELNRVEHGIKCLLQVLYTLDEMYDLNHENEMCTLSNVLIRQIESLHNDLETELEKLDDFLAEQGQCETN